MTLLSDALFKSPETDIFRIDESVDFGSEEFLDWSLTPISGKTLSEDFSEAEGVLDGYFLLKAIWVKQGGETETCYINVTVPERISDWAYLLEDGSIVRKALYEIQGDVLPAIAIECTGDYELFYSRNRPEIGIDILRNGLKHAKNRAPIADDLAYILRDENRYEEAISAFSVVIDEGEPNEYTFAERSGLYEAVGDAEKANLDAKKSQLLISKKGFNFPAST